jgi:SAM-dependent methyltransferase
MRRWLPIVVIGGAILLIVMKGARRSNDDGFEQELNAAWTHDVDVFRDNLVVTHQILELLDVHAGMSVADIGAGGGYYTRKLAQAVGPQGSVVATEINPVMVELLKSRKTEWKADNVYVKRVRPKVLGLQPGSVDRILLSNVYFFSECDREATEKFFREARAALRPGGLLVIMNDYVHLRGWKGPIGDPMKCGQERPEELIKIAGPYLSLLVRLPVSEASLMPGQSVWDAVKSPSPSRQLAPFELPGYLVSFGERPLTPNVQAMNGEEEERGRSWR